MIAMMHRPLTRVSVLIATLALAAGCAVSPAAATGDGVVTIAANSDYDSLDPATAGNSSAYTLAMALYSRMVDRAADGSFRPNLAEARTVTPTTIEFVIRPEATCTDGSALTARQAAASIQRLADPSTNSPNRSRTFGTGDVSVEADDNTRTVTVHNSVPFADMLAGLSSPWAGITCDYDPQRSSRVEAAPGTGPWVLDRSSSIRGAYTVLNLRDTYVAPPGAVQHQNLSETLIIRVIKERSTVANELVNGGVDVGDPGLTNVRVLREQDTLGVTRTNMYGSAFLYFRQDDGSPVQDRGVRRAIAQAVDRDSAAAAATSHLGSPASSYVTDAVDCTNGLKGGPLPFDLEAATQSMNEAGLIRDSEGFWERDGERLRVRLLAEPATFPAGNEYVRNALQQFGIATSLAERPTPEVLEQMATTSNWDVAIFPYGPPISTPDSASRFLLSDSRSNWSGIKNPRFDQLSRAANKVQVQDPRRCQLWEQAQQALLDQADIVPLWQANAYWFATDRLDMSNFRSPSGSSPDPATLSRNDS